MRSIKTKILSCCCFPPLFPFYKKNESGIHLFTQIHISWMNCEVSKWNVFVFFPVLFSFHSTLNSVRHTYILSWVIFFSLSEHTLVWPTKSQSISTFGRIYISRQKSISSKFLQLLVVYAGMLFDEPECVEITHTTYTHTNARAHVRTHKNSTHFRLSVERLKGTKQRKKYWSWKRKKSI